MPSAHKVAVFIDGNNLFHAARGVNLEVDYASLLRFLVRDDTLVRAAFYTGVKSGHDESATRQQGFLYWMRRNGFHVFEKVLRRSYDGSYRADLTVEIATDMMTLAPSADRIVLVSGAEEFAYCVQSMARGGCRMEVATFHSSLSPRLLEAADAFIDLEDNIENVSKNPRDYSQKSSARHDDESSTSDYDEDYCEEEDYEYEDSEA